MQDNGFPARFVVGVLATWRVTHLLVAEDGPADVVVRLRRRAGDGWIGEAMDCFYCLSVWTAYENKNDNSWSTIATYTVPADAPAGCYSFSFDTTSRAFNPAGSDGGYADDWNYDNPWPLESIPSVSVAVVGP